MSTEKFEEISVDASDAAFFLITDQTNRRVDQYRSLEEAEGHKFAILVARTGTAMLCGIAMVGASIGGFGKILESIESKNMNDVDIGILLGVIAIIGYKGLRDSIKTIHLTNRQLDKLQKVREMCGDDQEQITSSA